jgi:hypothetical protein
MVGISSRYVYLYFSIPYACCASIADPRIV